MKRLALTLFVLSFLAPRFSLLRADDNVGAIWTEVGVTKALPYNLSVEGSLGHRTLDWFDWSSRWDAGAGLSYKVNKYMKVGLSYTFIQKHYQSELKEHYSGTTGKWNGRNLDAANWANRHRVSLDVSGSVRFNKTFRISLRERYQYTRQQSRDVNRTKYRDPSYDGDLNLIGFDEITETIDYKSAKNRHLLRSRLKFSIDKKGWDWEPYVSVETHNDLASKMHLDKIRTAIGVDYAINKNHKIGLGYIFNHENDDDGDQNIHAINIGYNFKF